MSARSKLLTLLVVVVGILTLNTTFLMIFWTTTHPTARSEDTRSGAGNVGAVIDASKYPNLQAAFDALPEGGGIVQLQPRTYDVTAPLFVSRENTRIQGFGPGTPLRNVNANGQPALIVHPAKRPVTQQKVAHEHMLWRVQVADLRISGNPKSGDGILAIGINEIYLHNLFIDHNGGNGIKLADCYENPRVTDCNITYNKKAGLKMISSSHNPVITGCHFEENRDGVEAIHIYNICMTTNNFDDQTRHGIIVEDSWGGVLTGNMVEQCRGVGIIIDRDCHGMALTANIIGQNYQGGIDLRDGWNCAVSANTFNITHERSLTIGPNSGRITVTGNNFGDSHVGGHDARKEGTEPGTGIHLEGTTDISITGNVFTGLKEKGIQTKGECKRIIVSSNLTTDLPEKPGLDTGAIDLVVKGLNLDD